MKPADARYLKKGQIVIMTTGGSGHVGDAERHYQAGARAVIQEIRHSPELGVSLVIIEGPGAQLIETFEGAFPFEIVTADKPREIRVCVLSTAHLRPETLVLLNDTPMSLWPVYGGPIPEGYFILAHERDRADVDYNWAPELLEVSWWANENGYDYVRFDCDEPMINQLPVFEHG